MKSLAEKFAAKWMPEPNTGCWLWLGALVNGYGHLSHEGRARRAHRVSFEFHAGPVPNGMVVCHRCDTPACVNPDHLFLGTQADNVADMKAKHRQRACAGSRNLLAKLHESDIPTIRALHAGGLGSRSLAKRYGVERTTIRRVLAGRSWRTPTDPPRDTPKEEMP